MESTTAIILGYLGVALMVGLSGVASCIGTSIAGMASVGAMKKNGGAFGSYMILSAIPVRRAFTVSWATSSSKGSLRIR